MKHRRAIPLALLSICLALLLVTPQRADDPPARPAVGQPKVNVGAAWELTDESKSAVEKGLKWLAAHQNGDGSYGGSGSYMKHVGITGLAGLAFMSEGSLPGRGRYGDNVEKLTDFILANTSEDGSGLIASEVSHGPMYGHGFATLFLAEVYGMTRRDDVREKLSKAIQLIIDCQNDEGGWRYQPVKADADLSVTICQVMALRAARNAGVKVPKATIDRAIDYCRKSQNGDGGFSYTINSRSSAFPRSAAGVAALQYSGIYSGKEIDRGLAYLLGQKPGGSAPAARGGWMGHFFYGHYYAVQAFFLAGGKYWQQWFPAIRDTLIKMQSSEGAWTTHVGAEYATAMALIILQIPNRYLPILER